MQSTEESYILQLKLNLSGVMWISPDCKNMVEPLYFTLLQCSNAWEQTKQLKAKQWNGS